MSEAPEGKWEPWTHDGHRDYFAAIGYLCYQWNSVEGLYTHLASAVMGLRDHKKHDIIFRHFGIVTLGNFMREYADEHIPYDDAKAQLAHVTAYVTECRLNRNTIVHGFPEPEFDPQNLTLGIAADRNRPKPSQINITIADIQRACADCEVAGILSARLPMIFTENGRDFASRHLGSDWRTLLLAKPPLPKRIGAPPPRTPAKPKRQQRSSPR